MQGVKGINLMVLPEFEGGRSPLEALSHGKGLAFSKTESSPTGEDTLANLPMPDGVARGN